MKLYGFGNSRSFRIIWMFKELNLDYEYIKLNPKKGELLTEEFLALNPAGKVPVLIDNDLILTESAAIINYLGDHYQQQHQQQRQHQQNKSLLPQCGTIDRALYDQWCFFAMTELEQPLWTIAKHQFALPEKYHVPAILKTAIYEFRMALQVLQTGLSKGTWILGENFTAADIIIGHTLHWAYENKIKFKVPLIEQYHGRIMQRPAFIETIDLCT